MNADLTDQEQIERLKKWWDDFGKYIMTALVVGLIIGFAWRFWQGHQRQTAERASERYQLMLNADEKGQKDIAQGYAKTLINDSPKTSYAILAAMIWAEEAVGNNQYPLAIEKLEWVMNNSKHAVFKQIARIRLAKILLEQKKQQQALQLLAVVDDSAYQPLINEVLGDIYHSLGQEQKAQQYYLLAKNGLAAMDLDTPLLDLKIAQ